MIPGKLGGTVGDPLFDRPSTPDPRWAVLAGLRFALAMVVVSGHLTWFTPAGRPLLLSDLGGTAAVLGFLVISGYSIAHSLARRRAGFYRRRVVRIYPLYAAAVLYSLVPFWTGADALRAAAPGVIFARPRAWVVAGNLLLLQAVACPPVPSNNLVWTLGVEAACYAAAPALTAWPAAAVVAVAGVSAAAFAAYPWTGLPHYATLSYGLPLLLFAWAWLAGVLLHRCRTAAWAGAVVAGLGGVLLSVNHAYGQPYSVATFVGAVAVVTVAGRVPVGPTLGRGLNVLGDLSYPLYLFHLPTFVLGYGILAIQSPTALLAAGLAVSAAALFVEATLKPAFTRTSPRRAVPTRPPAQG